MDLVFLVEKARGVVLPYVSHAYANQTVRLAYTV